MQNKFLSLYITLAVMALILILTGLFLKELIGLFNIEINKTYLYIAQSAFILSGIADIVLLFYAKKKLS